MLVHGLGFQSSRDHLVVGFRETELKDRIRLFVSETRSDEDIRTMYFLGKSVRDYLPGDTRQWSLSAARQYLRKNEHWEGNIKRCLYRPFDTRYVLYDPRMVDWPRPRVMGHMLAENLCLLANRQSKEPFAVLCAANLTERKIAAVYDASTSFPLYLYPQGDNLLDAAEEGRRPNLSPEFVNELSEKLGLSFMPDGRGDLSETFGPEDVFHYAYAMFHSPAYRERYAEFLKRDFPRLPLTSDRTLFAALAEKGAELTSLHLMTSLSLDRFMTRFPEGGDNVVEKVRYDAANQRVHINNAQYFEGAPEETWGFRVGGYQVLDKWLKDRKGRSLSAADVRHYQRVVVALTETRRIMREIDETIPGWPLE